MSKLEVAIRNLNSPKARVRKAAAEDLALMGTKAKSSIRVLLPMLKDPSKLVRQAVSFALAHITVASASEVESVLAWLNRCDPSKEGRMTIFQVSCSLAGVTTRYKDALLEIACKPDTCVEAKLGLATQLAELAFRGERDRDLLPLNEELLRLFESDNPTTKETAALLSGRLGFEESLDPLLRLLTDTNESVLEAASRSLTSIGLNRGQPVLAPLLEHRNWKVRRAGIDGITHFLGPGSESLRLQLEKIKHSDKHPTVRRKAAWALNQSRATLED